MTVPMSKNEYVTRMQANDDWAPGWEAIDEAFAALYPGVNPPHLATQMSARAMFGGTEYIDGYSLFPSPGGYQHLLTYGMSRVYTDEQAFGGEFSGWGYEMTMKVVAAAPEDAQWAAQSLGHLGRYTYTSKRWFEPYQFISGGGQPLRVGSDSQLTSYLVVPDTEVPGIDTVHGRVDFLQLVGITQPEFEWLAEPSADPQGKGRELAARLAEAGNPLLLTDLSRTHSHV